MRHPPNNPAALAEAQAAAEGDTVLPIAPVEVKPGMMIWHDGTWLTVRFKSMAGEAFHIDFETGELGSTAFKFVQPDTSLFRRVADVNRPVVTNSSGES